MPLPAKSHKISNRLILYIILFSSMITAVVTMLQLYYEYIEDKSLLDSNIRNINTGYREGITNAVWLDDKEQLASILDGVIALPDIEYIVVRVNNKPYAVRGHPVKSNSMSSYFPLRRQHDNRLLTIGDTYVEADLSAIYRRLINHAWAILGLNAIKTFFVAMFMYFIFNRLVVTRLEKLSRFVRRYDIQDIGKENEIEPIIDKPYNDEISEITSALNTMHIHLSNSIKELLGLKKTLDLTLDGIFMFHPDSYRIFYANAGATALLGYTAEELTHMTPMDISKDMNTALFVDLASTADENDNPATDIETLFLPKDGPPIPVRLLLQYLHPKDESPRYVFMARDISEQIKAQQEIRNSLEEAKTANTELESFSYSISHDLRAPLRSIDGFSLLLLQDYSHKLDSEGRDYIHRVRNNAQHMGLLIDDMLSLSQVTRGELNRKTHDLSKLARTSVNKLREYEPDRKIHVTISPDIVGWVDKPLFENLLDNLIGNAWKYTSKTPEPHIEFGAFVKNNETIYYVRDNGAGFDMQYANKLFNPFQRLHIDEEFTGTGIGLATVSRIISRHGGRIWAEAAVDHGAVFYFTLSKEQRTANHNTQRRQA